MPLCKRSYLFLQGVCSPFFARLADGLIDEGHQVAKINVTGGDVAYWGRRQPAWSYRGRVDQFDGFLESVVQAVGATDMVLFGDRRPIHRPAVELARRHGIRLHVFEEGYFRPYWVTLEQGGVNAASQLPRDPVWYRLAAARLSNVSMAEPFRSPLSVRAGHDLLYHLAGIVNPLFFNGYQTHAPFCAPVMYAGYCRRFLLQPFHRQKDAAQIDELVAASSPYYFLPLQLNSDAQIRDHSPFRDMGEVMARVIASFADHAPADSRLVIKNHPLDMGLVNYRRIIRQLEERYDVPGRVLYLETGDLVTLLRHTRGVVTVNSTVGSWALDFACPTITLSDPIYNLPGLTFQGGLDQFWNHAEAPDPELFSSFKSVVIQTTQLNGGFYCATGIGLAVKHALTRLTTERSPLEELL